MSLSNRHLILRYSNHKDLLAQAGPLLQAAAKQQRPGIVVIPESETHLWLEHMNAHDLLSEGSSVRLLVYPMNMRGWAWGVRAAYVATQRALQDRLEGGSREVLVIVRLPDVLWLIGEKQGMEDVEKILSDIATIGTVVCAYKNEMTVPAEIASMHQPA